MNCPNQVNGEPCNDCYICESITNGSLEDVIEIDAASNNGVDEIRDIRDKSTYAPSLAKHKVYIIDEVHMLSTGAFNALLKTLEEPTETWFYPCNNGVAQDSSYYSVYGCNALNSIYQIARHCPAFGKYPSY